MTVLTACATTQSMPAGDTPAETPPVSDTDDARQPDVSGPDKDIDPEDNDAGETVKDVLVPHVISADNTGPAAGTFDAALTAFTSICEKWAAKPQDAPISADLPAYGTHAEWRSACDAAQTAVDAEAFFAENFVPVTLSETPQSLMTGYYEPEIEVRRQPSLEFSESILTRPPDMVIKDGKVMRQTAGGVSRYPVRSDVGPALAPVLAFGRPLDVFFMQIQGSGRLRFEDGSVVRAAYAAHNGRNYTSIGGVLIRRGILTRDTASKSAIENWMRENGREAARELMNQNDRYIFFEAQPITEGIGPNGAVSLPMVAMGSMAVDPAYVPYGLPVWVETKIPAEPGDYRGVETGLLLVALDTGGAIKGAMRGDIFFGSGAEAGARAGVMKHPSRWTVLLPESVAEAWQDAPS